MNADLRFYWDTNLIIESTEKEDAIIYSHLSGKKTKVNKFMLFFIRHIIDNAGMIAVEKIIQHFAEEFDIRITASDVGIQLNKLIGLHIFYKSQSELKKAESNFQQRYKNKIRTLSTAFIHQTLRCNFNCVYCYARKFQNQHQLELPESNWLKILGILRKEGVKHLIFTGGEPLVREDSPRVIAKAKEMEFNISVFTNGTLLKRSFEDIFSAADKVVVSLDSHDPDKNKTNRSGEKFAQIFDVLKRAAKSYPDKIFVRTVLTANNVAQLRDFHNFLKNEIGVANTIKLLFIPNSIEDLPLMPDIKQLYANNDFQFEYKSNASYTCAACNSIIALSPNGDIYPCQNLLHAEFRVGNILEPGWQMVLGNSPVRKRMFRQSADDKPKCRDCRYKYLCGGGCPAIAHNVYGDIHAHLDFFCDYLKTETRNRLIYSKTDWLEV